VLHKF